MSRFFQVLRLLSLDVVVGAVVGAWTFAHVGDHNPYVSTYLLLGITVWIIYSLDHLADAYRVQGHTPGGRHRFYYTYRKQLILAVGIFSVLGGMILFRQPDYVIRNGLLLSGLVAGYLLLVNYADWFSSHLKEFSCALLYTLGIMVPALPAGQLLADPRVLYLAVAYLLLAWLNLLLISTIENEYDKEAGFQSLITGLGMRNTHLLIKILFGAGFGLLSFGPVFFRGTGLFIPGLLILMFGVLLLIYRRQEDFIRGERYRVIGDAIFLIPLVLVAGIL